MSRKGEGWTKERSLTCGQNFFRLIPRQENISSAPYVPSYVKNNKYSKVDIETFYSCGEMI